MDRRFAIAPSHIMHQALLLFLASFWGQVKVDLRRANAYNGRSVQREQLLDDPRRDRSQWPPRPRRVLRSRFLYAVTRGAVYAGQGR